MTPPSNAGQIALGLPPLIIFSLVTCVSPGPSNTLVMMAAARYGVIGSLRLIAGMFVGFQSLLVAAALGAAPLINDPHLALPLRVLGAAYLLWLAWTFVRVPRSGTGMADEDRSATFMRGVLINWTNPKALAMVAGTVGLGAQLPPSARLPLMCLTMFGGGVVSFTLWVFAGRLISRALQNSRLARRTNLALGSLLALAAGATLFL